jgi:murein DD-endopeptidase MepM/ murein hydrolase activator NlpD
VANAETIPPRDGKASSKRARPRSPVAVGHTVRPGETLWRISRQHGVPVEALARANGLRTGQALRVGLVLAIPGTAFEPGRQEPPSPAAIVLAAPPEGPRMPLLWPVAAEVASGFGPRGRGWHGGIDIRGERGTPIRAAAAGMVITSGHERGYGNVIKIWHVLDLMTVYAHNLENHVRVGDWVEQGHVIGVVGGTGRATGPHLHFEVRLDGRKYDPLYWLSTGTIDVARAGISEPTRPGVAP